MLVTVGTEPFVRLRQHFLKRTQHQREGRAELVTYIAEERGFDTIDLGQSLRAPTLLVVRASAG